MERRRTLRAEEGNEMNTEFELLGEADVSNFAAVNTTIFLKSCNCNELLLVWEDMSNGANLDSNIKVKINNILVECGNPRTARSGSKLSGYTLYKLLNGCGTISLSTNGATQKTMYSGNAGNVMIPYNLIPVTEKFTKIELYNIGTQYFATSGTIKVYGR